MASMSDRLPITPQLQESGVVAILRGASDRRNRYDAAVRDTMLQRSVSGPLTAEAPAPVTAPQAGDERIPFRGVRKKIAENMHRSRQTAAHFTYVEECDMTELMALRKRAKARAEERGIKLSFHGDLVGVIEQGAKHPVQTPKNHQREGHR